MFTHDVLMRDVREIDREIERRCLAIGLNCNDPAQMKCLAHEVLRNIGVLKKAASEGDAKAKLKVDIYGLAMLMHRTNSEIFGPGYLARFDSVAKLESSWAGIAWAMWHELEGSDPDQPGSKAEG